MKVWRVKFESLRSLGKFDEKINKLGSKLMKLGNFEGS